MTAFDSVVNSSTQFSVIPNRVVDGVPILHDNPLRFGLQLNWGNDARTPEGQPYSDLFGNAVCDLMLDVIQQHLMGGAENFSPYAFDDGDNEGRVLISFGVA